MRPVQQRAMGGLDEIYVNVFLDRYFFRRLRDLCAVGDLHYSQAPGLLCAHMPAGLVLEQVLKACQRSLYPGALHGLVFM